MAFLPAAFAAFGASSAATAGAVVSALGVGASALASANAAKFQAGLAETQAKQARDQASAKAGEVASDTRQRLAAIRAGAIQNGFELTGSLNDLLDQTGRQGQLDYLTAVYDGSVQAIGLNATAKNFRSQAGYAPIGGALGAASSALGGVGSVFKMRGASINVSGT